jgi:hypothetical protein
MSKNCYLDEEMVEVELRDWFTNKYNSNMPVLEIIHEIENILRNMKPLHIPNRIYSRDGIYGILSKCPECGANILEKEDKNN